MSAAWSRGCALAGLGALMVLVTSPPDIRPGGLVSAVPLAALLLAGLAGLNYWAIATALVMLPYFSYGVMELLTSPAGRWPAAGFAALTIAIFLAALDSRRRA